MFTTIMKRDGRESTYDINKITSVIDKAFGAVQGEPNHALAADISRQVERQLMEEFGDNPPTVEAIQDNVERALIARGLSDIAKAFILYRAERSRIREMDSRLMKAYEDITFKSAIESDIKRENANIDGDSAMGTMLKYGSEGAKHFYELYVLDPAHAQAHREGNIHIHDMDFYTLTTTCCQIDLITLFKGGFFTGHGVLREPKDIASYSALACIAIQSNQNDQHGGQSIVNFDYAMALGVAKTYVRRYQLNLLRSLKLLTDINVDEAMAKDIAAQAQEKATLSMGNIDTYEQAQAPILAKLGIAEDVIAKIHAFCRERTWEETDTATHQAMEALIHNLNTMHSRAGAQTPFSSINYGMDTSPEGHMAIKNLLLATEEGLGEGETPIFPIQIFRVKEGINYSPGEPNYDLFQLACRVSAKRLFPNFSFQDAPFNIPYYKPGHPETEIAYMGCRTRVIGNVYDPQREISNGRGNLSFTSINLPRIGIESKGDIKAFYKMLDEMMELCIEQLMHRFKIQAEKVVRNFPFMMGNGVWLDSDTLGPDDRVEEILKHGTFSMGFIGLAETLVALTGKHHGESEESQKLGLEIITYMRARMDAESKKRGLNFTLLATPAEGLSGRFVKIDRKRYGNIPGITDREYYTNSFHIPVYYPISAFNKINLEAPYHALTNAGHITYIELDGDPSKNLDAFEAVIRTMHDAGIGYGAINHPVDRDSACGYNGLIDDVCPGCGRTEGDLPFERIRRITGYLVGTLDRFNNGKRAEERDRVKHGVKTP